MSLHLSKNCIKVWAPLITAILSHQDLYFRAKKIKTIKRCLGHIGMRSVSVGISSADN